MAHALSWETDMKKALAAAWTQGKQVLLDFFNPG
jgi:hypothetical protein